MTPPPAPNPRMMMGHPRRPPAHRSVSLLHSPRQRGSDSSSDNQQQVFHRPAQKNDSPSSLNPLGGKDSSGESSNAEKWFERSNNDVRDQSASFADNDPPFFMRNSSSSEEQADGQRSALRYLATDPASSLPMRTGLLHLGTDGSSTEDFRSVIDDLTIENKKLKKRLKKYEKLHDSHLKNERLFEVRIHGLPAEKKRELEETLRNFASELNRKHGAEFPSNGYEGLRTLLRTHKTASSATSMQNADSAYASMSASGQGSSTSDTKQKPFAQSARSRQQNIHTYLHHIPEGLLPQQTPSTMSERSKKKLVVRRLEQIFAGKGAATGGHQQAEQQQDVSHSAARADRLARGAQGHHHGKEGFREANFMREEEGGTTRPPKRAEPGAKEPKGKEVGTDTKVDQRPTRPLDLDLHRAQVPADNLKYMRHLGFEMPEPDGGSPQDDEGWVYLNLLVNMAQLHTISVTADFVRKAIGECSQHLELSSDGRRARWKGGLSVTRSSSNGGESINSRITDEDNSQSPRKRVKLSKTALKASKASHKPTGGSTSHTQPENSRFAYTPLFFHGDSTCDEESSSGMEDDDAMSSPFPAVIGGDSSGMTSSGIRTTSTKNKKKHDDGPIIFYNNARFCTDLSGDRKLMGSQGAPPYSAASVSPIGMPQSAASKCFFEPRGALAEATELPEPMDLSDNPIPESMELKFPPSSPSQRPAPEPAPYHFEVTGIGGVYPADNFAVSVESRHVISGRPPRSVPAQSLSKVVPPRFVELLKKHGVHSARPAQHKQFVASKTELAPSTLPPALNYMLTESDSVSDDGSEAEEHMSISPDSPDVSREPAPQQFDLPYSQSDDSDAEMDDEDESDVESDGSLDLLATARALDPEAVRAREREYDANMAERLAEEIPAGSSAATAGGGSGFASPASGVSRSAYQRARKEARSHRQVQRQQTTDCVALRRGSSSIAEESSAAE